jgi:hypothetical protein
MFSKHVTKDISAYCHGELEPKEAQQFAEHLIACVRCRAEFEEIKVGITLAEQLPRYSAPTFIWPELERLRQNQTARPAQLSAFRFWQPRFVAIAAALLLAIGVSTFLILGNLSRPSWEVARLDGMPRIDSSGISDKGRLAVGQWLETDGSSRAQISVSSIGQVQIDPNTRVRLLETRPTEHRLELAQGRMSARIWAPPRLFFVDTPSAVAADLGCAYTLEVNREGASLLHVTSGWVALQLKDRESMVPAGAACQTRPGIGPGTPYFEDASEAFRVSLVKFDFDPVAKTAALQSVLTEARPRDSLTLWHLLSRADGAERLRVYERLATLAPPPASVTRDGILQLNPEMLQRWREALESTWNSQPPGRFGKTLKKAWTIGLDKLKDMEEKK